MEECTRVGIIGYEPTNRNPLWTFGQALAIFGLLVISSLKWSLRWYLD